MNWSDCLCGGRQTGFRKNFIDGKQVKISSPEKGIKEGVGMIPEDRNARAVC